VIEWPKASDTSWREFDIRTVEIIKTAYKNKSCQDKMAIHCQVIYDEGVRWFGVKANHESKKKEQGLMKGGANRRQKEIDSLIKRRRELKKKPREVSMTKEEEAAALKKITQSLKRLRKAERRRVKQVEKKKASKEFKKNPFRCIKSILNPTPVGELKCTKEELDAHLQETYGDPLRAVPLGDLEGLDEVGPAPRERFDLANIRRREHDEVIKKARGSSAPGSNAIPYKVYKHCPSLSENLWVINRGFFTKADYPNNCRYSEGVYIPKSDGDFSPKEGRPISLGNVQGKIYLAVLARRMTSFMINNRFVNTGVQKGGVPNVKGCTEHFGAMWEAIKDAKLRHQDICVVWLDLANAYGAVPHMLILRALRYYHIPKRAMDIIMSYFSGVYGRFSAKELASAWQKFEIGIFMGCVISVILFVMCMNLMDELVKVKVPKTIQYQKVETPVPLLKLFMDDSCLTTSKMCDMQEVLGVVKSFVDWARFKLKSSKSRALVFEKGKARQWVMETAVVKDTLSLDGDVIPNVCEKPIKFLGRWIREDAQDKVVIQQLRQDLETFMSRLDQSALSGLQKTWGYQHLVLPKMKWGLAIYDIPLSTVMKWEQYTNRNLRSWLGAGHTLSRLCLFSVDSSIALPVSSLMTTWKIEKCRLQQSYDESPDEFIQSIRPQVRSGRAWKPSEALHNAKRDLECEAVRGMVQPAYRAGIGYGEWKKPWDVLSDEEKRKEVMGRVKTNIEREQESEYGSLELQSGWVRWREDVVDMSLSWSNLFQMGDSMVGFLLRAVYGTAVTPSRVAKWKEEEDGKCKLCNDKLGTIQHILTGCCVALSQGRYTWRHDKVLKEIHNQLQYHLNKRVNINRQLTSKQVQTEFITAGVKPPAMKKKKSLDVGILHEANDWVLEVDLGKQLKFPDFIAKTKDGKGFRCRPDIVFYSLQAKKVVWWELTVPVEERIAESQILKTKRYEVLEAACKANGWMCYNHAVEIGARGCVGESMRKAATSVGIRGRSLKKLIREVGRQATFCSKWVYWWAGRSDWVFKGVEPVVAE